MTNEEMALAIQQGDKSLVESLWEQLYELIEMQVRQNFLFINLIQIIYSTNFVFDPVFNIIPIFSHNCKDKLVVTVDNCFEMVPTWFSSA